MWICLNRAFLSIVTPAGEPDSDVLLVRARRKGDIQSVFPGAKVRRTPERDYLYRALIPRIEVARALADEVTNVDYSNFKNSVKNRPLHDAFARIWSIMAGLQSSAPYSGVRSARQRRLPVDELGIF